MPQLELQSLLAVHAHPDDETLSNAGLLAATAAAGLPVAVVTATRGELGEVIGPRKSELEGTGPVLAAHRTTELTGALAALGVPRHVFLDQVPGGTDGRFQDSGMAWLDQELGAGHSAAAALGDDVPAGALVKVPLADAAHRLARVITELAPHTVVTYEPGGGYGHPDHVRTYDITTAAIALAAIGIDGRKHEVQRLLWTVIPKEVLQAGRSALLATGNTAADASGLANYPATTDPIASVGVPLQDQLLTLDIRPVLANVLGALQSHGTQVQWAQSYASPVELEIANPDVGAAAGSAGPGAADHKSVARYELSGSYALSNNIVAPLLSHEFYLPAQLGQANETIDQRV